MIITFKFKERILSLIINKMVSEMMFKYLNKNLFCVYLLDKKIYFIVADWMIIQFILLLF